MSTQLIIRLAKSHAHINESLPFIASLQMKKRINQIKKIIKLLMIISKYP